MKTRLLFSWVLLIQLSGSLSLQAAAVEAKPNIILIFADDLGWKDVSWNNKDGFVETPNLDRLRKGGITFTQAYAAAGNCTPSRACLLSGKYGPRHGVYAVGDTDRGPREKFRLIPVPNTPQLRPEFVTMAEALQARDYATGHFGKWHVGNDKNGTGPRQQGFDVSPPGLVPANDTGEDGKVKLEDPKKIFSITTEACQFIEANKAKPFFAFVAHHAVHSGLRARPETLTRFQEKATTMKPAIPALLAACIFDMDAGVGQLLDQVERSGVADNTMIVFTSDNGGPPPSDNEPLRGAKGGYYEGGIREPFLMRWPGRVQPGSTSAVPVIHLDLYPTFLRAAGGTPGPDLDGADLLPLISSKAQVRQHSAVFWHFPGYLDKAVNRGRDPVFRTRPVSVIRQGDWKLHLYHEEWLLDGGQGQLATNRAVELYNLSNDPGERKDLATEQVTKRDELLSELLNWIQKTKAPLPTLK